MIDKTLNYTWSRLKRIGVMIILILVVKHPSWDRLFWVLLIIQALFIVFTWWYWYILSKKMAKQETEERRKSYFRYNKKFYYRRQKQQTTDLNIKSIKNSAQLLGINIIQDNENIIKKKYRKLAMKWHPDRFATDIIENQVIANRNFQKLNTAYEKVKKYKNMN